MSDDVKGLARAVVEETQAFVERSVHPVRRDLDALSKRVDELPAPPEPVDLDGLVTDLCKRFDDVE